jgi:hypothetical protein
VVGRCFRFVFFSAISLHMFFGWFGDAICTIHTGSRPVFPVLFWARRHPSPTRPRSLGPEFPLRRYERCTGQPVPRSGFALATWESRPFPTHSRALCFAFRVAPCGSWHHLNECCAAHNHNSCRTLFANQDSEQCFTFLSATLLISRRLVRRTFRHYVEPISVRWTRHFPNLQESATGR